MRRLPPTTNAGTRRGLPPASCTRNGSRTRTAQPSPMAGYARRPLDMLRRTSACKDYENDRTSLKRKPGSEFPVKRKRSLAFFAFVPVVDMHVVGLFHERHVLLLVGQVQLPIGLHDLRLGKAAEMFSNDRHARD